MQRRTLLRKLAEGLTLAGHQACRSMAIVPAEPAPKASMPLPSPVPAPSSTPPPVTFACDLSAPSQPLRHPWRHCVGSCHAPTALRADWQQQMTKAHRELGFRHVRFHGLLSDDMGTLVNQEMLDQLGTRRWPVAPTHSTVTAHVGAPEDDGRSAVLLINVAMPRRPIATEVVTVQLGGLKGRRPRAGLLSRIDATHANPQAEWLRMGSPEYPRPHQVDALNLASTIPPEPIAIAGADGQASFTLPLAPDAMALVRIEWEAAA